MYLSDIFYFSFLLTLAPATLVFFLFLGHTHNPILPLSFCTLSSLYQQGSSHRYSNTTSLGSSFLTIWSCLALQPLFPPSIILKTLFFFHSIWHCLPIYNLISYQECKLHEMKDLLLLLFISLFIFGCTGSSVLGRLFSSRSQRRLLIAVASPVVEHRLHGLRASVFAAPGHSNCDSRSLEYRLSSCALVRWFTCSAACASFPDKGSNPFVLHW